MYIYVYIIAHQDYVHEVMYGINTYQSNFADPGSMNSQDYRSSNNYRQCYYRCVDIHHCHQYIHRYL